MTLVTPHNGGELVLARLAGATGRQVLLIEDGQPLEAILQAIDAEMQARGLPHVPVAGTPDALTGPGQGQPGLAATVRGAAPGGDRAPLDYRSEDRNSYAFHDAARRRAETVYDAALHRYLTAAEAEALKAKRSKRVEEDLLTLWLLLMEEAEETGFQEVVAGLGGARGLVGSTANAQGFAQGRQQYLGDFGTRAWKRLATAADMARQQQLRTRQVLAAVRKEAQAVAEGEGRRVVETEAQATYGDAQRRMLKSGGFKTAVWMTMEDERVRPSHQAQHAMERPLGQVWPNGCAFPGDPKAPLDETINCRCWLVGGSR